MDTAIAAAEQLRRKCVALEAEVAELRALVASKPNATAEVAAAQVKI